MASYSESARIDLRQLQVEQPDWFTQAFDMPREEGFVRVDGVDIHYFRWGDPSLPAVVLTHGFMAHARCWAFIAPLLADKYCLAAFDLSGMGDSGWRSEYDVIARAKECLAIAQGVGFEHGQKPSLVCHSYGGGVGMSAVELYPDEWSSLLVCDMTMLAPGETASFSEHRRQRQLRGVQPHRVYADFATVQERFRLAPEQPCANKFLLEYMAKHSVRAVDGGFVWKFDPQIMSSDEQRDDNWWQSISTKFSALETPRGIIYGQWSSMMSEQAVHYIRAQTNGQVPVIEIPAAYHHVMLDQPLNLAGQIGQMLDTLLG